MSRYDVVRNGLAENTILWDGETPLTLEPGQSLLAYSAARTRTPRPIEDTNRDTLVTQGLAAFAANRTYVALASPTTAQNTAQVKALTRQMNGVLRLLLGVLDGTD